MENDKIEIINKKYDELFNNNKKIQNEEFKNTLLNKENEINNKINDLINNKIKPFFIFLLLYLNILF